MYVRRLIAIFCSFVASLAYSQPMDEADIIVIARVLGPAEYDKRLAYYEDGTVVPDVRTAMPWMGGSWGTPVPPEHQIAPYTWIPRVRFETVLALKGDPAPEFTYTNLGLDFPTVGTSPNAEPARSPGGLGRSSEDPTGRLYLLCLGKPRANRLFAGTDVHYKPMFIEPKSNDEYMSARYALGVPDAPYVLEGKTTLQRWASIIVQAWQKEPARTDTLLKFVSPDYLTWVPDAEGNPVAWDPAFAKFAKEKLAPRLESLKGDLLLNKIRANYWSWLLTVDTNKYFPEFRQLVEELDRTWPDPDGPIIYRLDGLYGPEEFIRSLVSAGTVFIRKQAIQRLTVDHSNLKVIVDRLRVEESYGVQRDLLQWLSRLGHKEYPRYAEAPIATINRGAITNLEEIIGYWSDK